jgi:iron complex outermembrane recepter protein
MKFFLKAKKLQKLFLGCFCALNTVAFAQHDLTGTVTDEKREPIAEASLALKGQTAIGTATNATGKFKLTVPTLPATLIVSFVGYKTQEVEVRKAGDLEIQLKEGDFLMSSLVVTGASRREEKIMQAPVSIQKLDAKSIAITPSANFFDAVGTLKGIQVMNGSLTNSSVNARGFADMNNLRFLQFMDGMDLTTPGFGNYGNPSTCSQLDLQSVEFIPGASSSLYGANAFNGILLFETKDPFKYQGLSFQNKLGMTKQSVAGTNTYNNFNFRYAKAWNDKFAVKFDFENIVGTDWMNDDKRVRYRTKALWKAAKDAGREEIEYNPNSNGYDAISLFGDQDQGGFANVGVKYKYPATGRDTTITMARSGLWEKNVIDHTINNYKFNANLYYKITPDWQISYLFKQSNNDLIVRHTTAYAFKDLVLNQHKLELKGKTLTVRGYYSGQKTTQTYNTGILANKIQKGLTADTTWGRLMGEQLAAGKTIAEARTSADQNTTNSVGSAEWKRLWNESVGDPYPFPVTVGGKSYPGFGSQLVEYSSFMHFDVLNDFSSLLNDVLQVQAGASWRKYTLNSKGDYPEGTFFSDNRLVPTGYTGTGALYSGSIGINEIGIFGQASKKWLDDRLKLQVAGRYNKSTNFDANFTPSASVVYSAGKEKEHNFRVSVQTGFRNPSLQEQYLNFFAAPTTIVWGGTEDNINHIVDKNLATGAYYSGQEIKSSFKLGSAAGPAYTHIYNVPERATSYEIGYKGLIAERLFVDFNYYNTTYEHFAYRRTAYSPLTNKTYLVWGNAADSISVGGQGYDVNLEYAIPGGYRIGANYAQSSYSITNKNNNTAMDFYKTDIPSFNTPKSRINLSVENSNVSDSGFGFSFKYRWVEGFEFESAFGYGALPSYSNIDAAVFYKVKKWNATLSLGGNNLLGQEYRTVYAGPMIGSIYYLSLRVDDLLK